MATVDERHLKGRASMRTSDPPSVSSETPLLAGLGAALTLEREGGSVHGLCFVLRRKQQCEQAEPGCAFSFST